MNNFWPVSHYAIVNIVRARFLYVVGRFTLVDFGRLVVDVMRGVFYLM